jgi:hypothetical protein
MGQVYASSARHTTVHGTCTARWGSSVLQAAGGPVAPTEVLRRSVLEWIRKLDA